MDATQARRRFAAAAVARLATVRPDGSPHVVPISFALADDVVYTAIDHKPKSATHSQRLVNLHHDPRCSVLVDHYADDWSALWWVRVDGTAAIVEEPAGDHPGIERLVQRYAAYEHQRPSGPLIAITVTRWRGWAAGEGWAAS